jgi:hypothetical protein
VRGPLPTTRETESHLNRSDDSDLAQEIQGTPVTASPDGR